MNNNSLNSRVVWNSFFVAAGFVGFLTLVGLLLMAGMKAAAGSSVAHIAGFAVVQVLIQ